VLQREIAEHLQLPTEVMEMFDWQDEEDDIRGVTQGSRHEIPQVLKAMFRRIKELNHRFLVIFHNGSSEEIDLSSFGFPLSGYMENMVLWTFQGRFRLYPRMKVDSALHNSTGTTKTDVFLSASYLDLEGRDSQEVWSVLVHREAAEVAENSIRIHTAQVAECFFLHMLKLCCIGYNFMTDYDLATHAYNYWVCDGIMQQLQLGALGDTNIVNTDDDDEESWRTADALQREIQLDVDYYNYNHQYFPSHLVRYGKTMPCWTSPYGFMLVPVGAIPSADMLLQDFNNLTVLKLSRCTFSFSSPLFLYYHNLKFLWLDHCEGQEVCSAANFPNEGKKKISMDRELKEADIQRRHRFFQKLWVLDVRYTSCDWILSAQMMDFMTKLRELTVMGAQDWDMGQLHGRLPNIRKLRVTKSTIRCSSCLGSYLFSEMDKMELLDLSGNNISPLAMSFSAGPAGSNNNITTSSVVTVIIDDKFVGLKEISLRGCANLKNLFLRGVLQDLCSLDISGTAVKTLDLSAMTAPNLDELYLLGCDKLCAILWPTQDKRKNYLNKLHIDTNTRLQLTIPPGDENNKEGSTSGATAETSSPSPFFSVLHGGKAPYEFEWYISVWDVRFLLWLAPMRSYFDNYWAHLEISSSTRRTIDAGGSIISKHNEGNNSISVYADVGTFFKDHLLQARKSRGDDAPTITETWPCPDAYASYDRLKCYMNIQDNIRTKSPLGVEETMTSIAMPDFICDRAFSLHVHDALSMSSISGPAPGAIGGRWNDLCWCRVERCPNLDSVFTTPLQVAQGGLQADGNDQVFWYLRTFWGSQLPKVCFIWNWGTTSSLFRFYTRSFEFLQFLHLDLCPRLIHVLPLPMSTMRHLLRNLVALEIVWCSDLKVIFPFYSGAERSDMQQDSMYTVELWSLRHMHLHELPRLHGICGGSARLVAPNLETIKIRGCWNLRRLPAITAATWSGSRYKSIMEVNVKCDCEKEWWDRLEWDGLRSYHHPSLYQPTHPRSYKKTMLRGSVLV
jgi:hypothetical protein